MVIELPQLLQVPTKLIPLMSQFDGKRYFLIEGGRGGGKSQAVGRWILYLAEKHNIRIVCGREIQNSIKESVYSLLTDLIFQYKLNFQVFAKTIVHRESKTEINFRGFREQGAFNIQGMEAIDIVWIDESQAITKQTLDVLIPTIRKDSAKIIFTMNRFVRNDPVYSQFINRDDCLHINLNYNDNPFCTKALIHEAQECQKKSDVDYNHIWLGLPLDKTEDAVFTHSELMIAKGAKYPLRQGYFTKIGGFDIAAMGDDKCACVVLQQMGALHWEVVFVETWHHHNTNFTSGKINELVALHKLDKAVIDVDGLGVGPFDTLKFGRQDDRYIGFRNPALSYLDNKEYGNKRTENTYKLKELINAGHICITQDEVLDELETCFRYTYDHNQRKILIDKKKMKSEGVHSPDIADALIMAISQIEDVQTVQDKQYQPRHHQEGDNLFAIAGVR